VIVSDAEESIPRTKEKINIVSEWKDFLLMRKIKNIACGTS